MSNTNPPDHALSWLPLSDAQGRDDRNAAADRRSAFRRVAGRWWQVSLLWLVLLTSVCVLYYVLHSPTDEASSLMRIESAFLNCSGPPRRPEPAYIQRQVELITSANVITSAIADPQVAELHTIRSWGDPKTELLERLKVAVDENTCFIRVSLSLSNPNDAVTIVRSVIMSYLAQNAGDHRTAHQQLAESLKQQLVKIGTAIDFKRSLIEKLYRKGTIPILKQANGLSALHDEGNGLQPLLEILTDDNDRKIVDEMDWVELELIETMSTLDAEPDGYVAKKLEQKVDSLKKKKAKVAEFFKVIQVEQHVKNGDTFETSVLSHQVETLQGWEEAVKRKMEQMDFVLSQDEFRIVLIDPASSSRTPLTASLRQYSAMALTVVLFLLFGLYLMRERPAGRKVVAREDGMA